MGSAGKPFPVQVLAPDGTHLGTVQRTARSSNWRLLGNPLTVTIRGRPALVTIREDGTRTVTLLVGEDAPTDLEPVRAREVA